MGKLWVKKRFQDFTKTLKPFDTSGDGYWNRTSDPLHVKQGAP